MNSDFLSSSFKHFGIDSQERNPCSSHVKISEPNLSNFGLTVLPRLPTCESLLWQTER
jgi:hypothetical protein